MPEREELEKRDCFAMVLSQVGEDYTTEQGKRHATGLQSRIWPGSEVEAARPHDCGMSGYGDFRRHISVRSRSQDYLTEVGSVDQRKKHLDDLIVEIEVRRTSSAAVIALQLQMQTVKVNQAG